MARSSRNLIALLAALGAFALVPASASAATITVNSTADTQAEDGACTLREAIIAANGNNESGNGMDGAPECVSGDQPPTVDTIAFGIPGAGAHLISPGSALPAISETVTIDGADALPAGPPVDEVRLDGAGAGAAYGLDVNAADVTVTNLTITRFFAGIELAASDGATVTNSFLGTDQAGTASLGNVSQGVRAGSLGSPATNAEIRQNVISGNGGEGVLIEDGVNTGNVVAFNLIGTTPAGTAALANSTGVEIRNSGGNRIGGPAPLADRNVISGNNGHGVRVSAGGATRRTGNVIRNNRIGTTPNGEAALPNFRGIGIDGNVDGAVVRSNLLSGNTTFGVELATNGLQGAGQDGPTGTVVAGNLIGTDKDGEADLGNGSLGFFAQDGETGHPIRDTTLGGTMGLTPAGDCTGDCNLISGNNGGGIGADSTVAGLDILGNRIGTDLSGTAALGNGSASLELAVPSGLVIGAPGAGNVIAAGAVGTVRINGATTGAVIQSNLIGVGVDNSDLGGGGDAIDLQASGINGSLIGGTGAAEGNVIAHSGVGGVKVESGSTDNAILGNAIYDSNALGIDLLPANGVTPNDGQDLDSGGNDLQNFPVLTGAVAEDGSTVVTGFLTSAPSTDYLIDVFSSQTQDGTSHGEAEDPLGSFQVSADGNGDAVFAATVEGEAGADDFVTATATELDGSGNPLSTSEFSENITEGCDVTGTSGDDPALTGTGGDDVICALEGDDVIVGGGGDDVIVGGPGVDEIDYSTAAIGIDANLVTGSVAGGPVQHYVSGVEDLTGTDFPDTMLAGAGDHVLDGGDEDDLIESAEGDDKLKGGGGKDTLLSKDGKDKLRGGDGGDDLDGGKGDKDDLDGDDGKDEFDGGKGDKDDCDGGPDKDRKPAKGCEKKRSIP